MISIEHAIEFINNKLKKSNGQLKPLPADKWWSSNNAAGIKEFIFASTSFLGECSWPQRLWHILNNQLSPTKCNNSVCSNSTSWSTQSSSYSLYCSKQCATRSDERKAKFAATCLERYGTTAPAASQAVQRKRRANSIEKHGVDHPSKTDSVKKSIKQAFVNKYGVDNPAKVPEVYERIRATNVERYGVEIPIQNDSVLAKRTATNFELYGAASPTQNSTVRAKQIDTLRETWGVDNIKYRNIPTHVVESLQNKNKFLELVSGKYMSDVVSETGLDITTLYKYVAQYDCASAMLKDYGRSSLERDLEAWLTSKNIEFETSNRSVIAPRELDFYLPKHKLAIEINGVYYHSEQFGKDKYYHYNKWKQCADQGITLLTYFDDDIVRAYNVIKSKILYLTKTSSFTKIGGRNLTIGTPSVSEERAFFTANHIQGFLNNRNATVGAYYNGQLVAAMCFTNRSACVEITRFAVDLRYNIAGAFSKLLQSYITSTNYKGTIVSFSDNCHSNGALYKTAGFTLDKHVEPCYYYTHRGAARENRQRYMKDKIARRWPHVDMSLTEHAIMQSLNYQRVWDCGKIKWTLSV